MKPLACLLALLSLAATAPAARAAESFDACTATISSLPISISTGGRYCLTADVATAIASGTAIDVNASNVTIDCNGFKIGNLAAGAGSTATGVFTDRANTRVLGCHFRGFWAPVMGVSAHGARIERNLFEGALYYGVYLTGDGTRIRDNQLVDTGGTATYAYAIRVDGRGLVEGNVVDGVSSTGAPVRGIDGNGDFVVADNTIRGLVANTASNNYGIYFTGGSNHLFIEGNRLQATSDLGASISCSGYPIVRNNTAIGFVQFFPACPNHGGNVIRSSEPS